MCLGVGVMCEKHGEQEGGRNEQVRARRVEQGTCRGRRPAAQAEHSHIDLHTRATSLCGCTAHLMQYKRPVGPLHEVHCTACCSQQAMELLIVVPACQRLQVQCGTLQAQCTFFNVSHATFFCKRPHV